MIYLDNSATTKTLPTVIEKMTEMMTVNYGNPATITKFGLVAEKEIKNTAQIIAKNIGAKADEIYFTSGGTESDNWAIFGIQKPYKRNGSHIITTKIEHLAIKNPIKYLEDNGSEITYISVDNKGYLNLDELRKSIRPDTILVSIIFVNNEVGTIQDLVEIGKIIKEVNPKTLFHVDAVQGFGKHTLNMLKMKIDLMSFSGHKIHGAKGTGGLFVKKGVKLSPMILGGGQQNGMRGGTENTVGVAGLGVACDEAFSNMADNLDKVSAVKKQLADGILNIENTEVNGDLENGSPYVLNVTFKGLRSEVLLHSLEAKEIYVSAGSACDSKKQVGSAVLGALGFNFEHINGAIRFSFSRFTTPDEISECLKALNEVVPFLRKYNR